MRMVEKIREKLFEQLLSKQIQKKGEKVIITIAIISFLLHLVLVFMVDFKLVSLEEPPALLTNPIAAIYTPFSFILIYEVYLLIFYLPQSTTSYIGKQYEIITLIVIRSIFKDLANLDLTKDWFKYKYDLQFTYDIIATILLFVLIFLFYYLNKQRLKKVKPASSLSKETKQFIGFKKSLSIVLVPTLLVLATYSFGNWLYKSYTSLTSIVENMRDVNQIFFDDFFTILILVDVLVLLFSLYHTHQFSKVIRNSGFIISTILIKLSFSTEGLLSTVLIVVAVTFGVIILWIHNFYQKLRT